MSFSINDLSGLTPSEPVDMTAIAPKRGPRFPKAGIYTLRVPDVLDPAFTFGSTKAGYLSAEINPTIVGPENAGYEVRFVKLSSKTFPESVSKGSEETRLTSQLARFLGACGYQGPLATDEDKVNAVLSTAGTEFRAVLDWRVWNTETQEETTGMENFPLGNNGFHLPWIESETELVPDRKTGEDVPKRYSARIFIKRFFNR